MIENMCRVLHMYIHLEHQSETMYQIIINQEHGNTSTSCSVRNTFACGSSTTLHKYAGSENFPDMLMCNPKSGIVVLREVPPSCNA